MTKQQVSPPITLAVSMDAAREALRRDDTALDLSIGIALAALIADAEQLTGQAFVNRPMRVSLNAFPDVIRLAAPTFSVESVQYLDVNGQPQIVDPADYYVNKAAKPGYIVPAAGKGWPGTLNRVNAVTIDFTAGYGPTDTTVPNQVKHFVLARLQQEFDPDMKANTQYLDRLLDSLAVF